MTARIGSAATAKVMGRLAVPSASAPGIGALLDAGSLEPAQLRAQNVAADIAERSGLVKYPVVHVFCEKIVNSLAEKFRSFSGKVEMAIELRHSQDRLDGLQEALELYADAATQTLNAARGDWGDGMFYAGGYEVAFSAVKRGGRNFIQVARVTFEIGVSRN